MFSVFVAFLMNKVYYNKGPIQLTTKKMIIVLLYVKRQANNDKKAPWIVLYSKSSENKQ